MKLLAAMMCLGVSTLLAQMAVMRELTVVCLGNELTMGVVFTVWLLSMGAGMGLGRFSERVGDRLQSCHVMVGLLVLLALVLPVVIVFLRLGGGLARGGAGQYVSLPLVFLMAAIALAPIAIPAGMLFPAACQAWTRSGSPTTYAVYITEAVGSFLGGAGYSFLLVGHLGGLHVATMGSGLALLGAGLVSETKWRRYLLPAAVGLVVLPAVVPSCLNGLERLTMEARWRSFGLIRRGGGEAAVGRMVCSFDTRYQNLALLESDGQFTLYGDGQVLFSFPDERSSELAVAFIMAQNPRARRVLLLGGNPMGEVAQLLKYPLETLVQVDLDPGVGTMVRRAVPELVAALDRDPRLQRVVQDGPLFVATCREPFDVILVHAPEPLTGGQNRFYTREFYENVRRLLAPGGFMHTSVEGSERLEREASRLAASIYRALGVVFEDVQVTSGAPLHFFAAREKGVLTFEREALVERWRAASVATRYFLPEYFLGADEIDAEKMNRTKKRLMAAPAEMNTLLRPVSYYYTLVLWTRYSGSPLSPLLSRIERVPPWTLCLAIMLGGIACWAAGPALRNRTGRRHAVLLTMAGIGFCGVALELILIYVFQGLYGCVHSRVGLMVGIFMLGSIVGAGLGRGWEALSPETVQRGMVLANAALLAVALALPRLVAALVSGLRCGPEMIYLMLAVVGAVVGAQFVGANSVFQSMGLSRARAASATGVADYWGSALGGMLVGVLFVPVWGVEATCVIVASVLGVGILCLTTVCDRCS